MTSYESQTVKRCLSVSVSFFFTPQRGDNSQRGRCGKQIYAFLDRIERATAPFKCVYFILFFLEPAVTEEK